MTKEINDYVVQAVESKFKHFEVCYADGEKSDPKEYEDDCFLHISRGKYRFVFYNGQDEGMLRESQLGDYAKRVDKILKEV